MTRSTPRERPEIGTALSIDTVLELVANQRRRFALYAMIDSADDLVDFETLIEEVSTLEAARTHTALTHEQYRDVAVDLYRWHLPVLADVGVVDFDTRDGLVRYWPQQALETWVTRVRRDELAR